LPNARAIFGRGDDGSVIRFEFPDEDQSAAQVQSIWPPLGLSQHDTPPSPPMCELSISMGWEQCKSALGLFAAEHLIDYVAVHAGLIVIGNSAVILPGPSLSGKSTLCEAAGSLGLRVLSDEYALVKPDGTVVGWPRPIRLRNPDGTWRHGQTPVTATRPYPVGLIATLTFTEGVSGAEFGPCTPGDATLDLLANTVCAQLRPEVAFHTAVHLARSCPAVRGMRGEAEEAVASLIEAH